MKKTLTTTLLAILMCVCMVFGFTACGNKCNHSYDNACDITCNECDEERSITHTPNDDDGDCTTEIICSICESVTTPAKDSHTGGSATCTDKAVCTVCNTAYGTVDVNNHIDENTDHICDRECGKTDIGTHADSAEDNDHVCDYGCGKTLEDHKGGNATCTAKAVCEECGEEYGELLPHVYDIKGEVVDPTCTAKGYTVYSCSVGDCGTTENRDEIEMIDHTDIADWDGKCDVCQDVVKEPTTFTATVKDDLGNPMVNVALKIYTSTSEKMLITDENGNVSCEFLYFDKVSAIIISVPVGYESLADKVYDFDGTSLSIEINRTVLFSVLVLDENYQGVAGIGVGFTHPSYTLIQTDENGYAHMEAPAKYFVDTMQSIFIYSIPDGYMLTDTAFNTLIELENNGMYVAMIAPIAEYTLSARDEQGNPFENAIFKITDKYGYDVTTATIDASGTVTLALPKDKYTVEISHVCAFFAANESMITLTPENNSYEAVFTEVHEAQLCMNVFYEDGTISRDYTTNVYMFKKESARYVSLLVTNYNGQAVANSTNDDYVILVVDKDLNSAVAYYNKYGPTTFDIVLKKGATAGQSEENALLINALLDLPYDEGITNIDWNRTFTAGESMYLRVTNAIGKTVTINGDNFTLEYKGVEISPDENGLISLTFTDTAYNEDAIIKITAKVDATEDLQLIYVGVFDNPIQVLLNTPETLTQTVTFYVAEQTIFFSFYNTQRTAVILTVDAEGAEVQFGENEDNIVEVFETKIVAITAKEAGELTITFSYEELPSEE